MAQNHNQRATDELHPAVFRIIMVCVACWAVITASFFIGGSGYGYLIALVVTVFATIVLVIPSDLARIQKHHPMVERGEQNGRTSWREWLTEDFEIWDGRTTTRDAAVAILLPALVAVIGGAIFALIFHLEG